MSNTVRTRIRLNSITREFKQSFRHNELVKLKLIFRHNLERFVDNTRVRLAVPRYVRKKS